MRLRKLWMQWAASRPSSTVSKRQSIAPKLRACVISWPKSKTKTSPAPASLLTSLHSFIEPKLAGRLVPLPAQLFNSLQNHGLFDMPIVSAGPSLVLK